MLKDSSALKSFGELGQKLNREGTMETTTENKSTRSSYAPLPFYEAKTKFYNHNKRFGFVYVTIPAGTSLEYEVKTSDQDENPGTVYAENATLDRDIVTEAFIHGTVIEKAGYKYGLADNQELKVKIASQPKGIQVVDTPYVDGKKPPLKNEPRPCNAALKQVSSKIKVFFPDKRFGFTQVTQDPETGEDLPNGEVRDVHFAQVALDRAGYKTVEPGDVIPVLYWTYSNGQSSVVQFKFKDGYKQASHDK